MAARDWSLPRVLAHRCGGTLAPENTLAGLAVAAACNCGGVEFDVMLNASGSPVLIHDETLERTTSGRGRVADLPDEAMATLDAGTWFDSRFAGERIPSLESALARCIALDLAINLEIKPSEGADEATAECVVRTLRRHWSGGAPPLVLSSFSEASLAVAAALAPEMPRGLLVGAVPDDWEERCRRLGAVSLHAGERSLDHATVAAVRQAGLRMACYTVNDPLQAQTLSKWGVDCVITDRPDIVRAADRGL
ncbi:glycerophosphodiester phosphodiesterase [Azoarcus sp. KH32C]|uniref:glycerophosphodiester phosphodiesterase n=1 Tax=Azoarcus sp. KH32C TaxID=748247 RepID=UPI0002385E9E|nr:glycerophosphodiester phosphodiesterase [Azoarcus sp. KH32C]BAL23457.1 cytoplasmic glycerophosphodiester phosphodiesterase [Azoarcus sp. KH32C]